jgi:hypothetical protein
MNDDDRPEWVKCIKFPLSRREPWQTWCDRNAPLEWMFQDIDHAAFNGLDEGRMVACPKCVAAVMAALRAGHEE